MARPYPIFVSYLLPFLISARNFSNLLFSWIFFRASSFGNVGEMLSVMFSFDGAGQAVTDGELLAIGVIIVGCLSQLLMEFCSLGQRILALSTITRAAFYGAITLLVIIFGAGDYRPFIYFQF